MIPIEYLVIDTWVWIEYFRGSDPAIREVIESRKTLHCLDVRDHDHRDYPEIQWVSSKTRGGDAPADQYRGESRERRFRRLRLLPAGTKRRVPGGTADAIILATALRANGRVMTGDLHFKGLYDTLFVGS